MTTMLASRGSLRAEWIKLRSVRSTYVILAIAVGLGLGVGLLDVTSISSHWATMPAADRAAFDPVGDSFSGFQFGQLAFGALGVLAISTEYSTGLIRTSLVAVPRRGPAFAARVAVTGAFALIAGELCAFSAFFLGQAVLASKHLDVTLAVPGVARAVGCAGLYMAVVTMVGFGLGAILRHTAAALATMVGLIFLAWPVARAVEGFSYLPDRLSLVNAADTLTATHRASGPHAARLPSTGLAWADLALYLAIILGFGAWRAHRDA